MIKIEEVKTKKQQKLFVNFPLILYKNCEYYVPNLYIDEISIFGKKCTYSEDTECIYYLAYKNDILVGRIQGIIQLAYNKEHNTKFVRFGRFDCVDDQDVANALFDAVFAWSKEKGMEQVLGPLGFSDFEREGLLIEGFGQKQTFEEQYNYEYYQKLIENYGFEKDIDWIEFDLRKKKDLDPRFFALSDRILEKQGLRVVDTSKMSNRKFTKTYMNDFFELVEICYKDLYGVCPFSEKAKDALVNEITYLLNPKYLTLIVDKTNRAVAFSLALPSLSDAIRKSKGHLTLRCIVNVLKAVKKPEVIDLLLTGIRPEYQNKGLTVVFLKQMNDNFESGVKYYQTNLNLEDNYEIINCWKYFDAHQNKRRRCYKKAIN